MKAMIQPITVQPRRRFMANIAPVFFFFLLLAVAHGMK
jgi:hypothetical protein